jgi:hypothetical protein
MITLTFESKEKSYSPMMHWKPLIYIMTSLSKFKNVKGKYQFKNKQDSKPWDAEIFTHRHLSPGKYSTIFSEFLQINFGNNTYFSIIAVSTR